MLRPEGDGSIEEPYPNLASLSSYKSSRLGISETFLTPELGGATTVAVLTSPLGTHRPTAWVLCHSFGLEQIYLQPLEVPMVRELASQGSNVLRFQSQGYGDSELPANVVSLSSHIRDAMDAVGLLRERGAERVGIMGSRFGASVAAITADRTGADALVLWEPALRGRDYINALTRRAIVSQLTIQATEAESEASSAPIDPLDDLADEDAADLQGFPLTAAAHDEIMRLDLVHDLRSFSGDVLIVQISKTSTPRPALKRLEARFLELGATVTHEIIEFRRAELFGRPRYRPDGNGGKVDTQADLFAALSERTVGWVTGLAETAVEVADQ